MSKMLGAIFLVFIASAESLTLPDTSEITGDYLRTKRDTPEGIEDILGPGIQDAFFHTYGDDKDGDGDLQGYSKKYDDDGEDGYKHFDSYHKKDGDNYAFEKHTEYGQENKNEADAGEKSQKLQENEEINDYDDAEEEDETKNVYKVAVPLKEVGKKYLKSNPSATYRQKRQSDDRSYERRSNRRRDRYDDDDDDDDDDRRGRRYRQSDEDDDDY
ncbi:unnamed protein product [Brassicogethes aeneus]|uniref:Uncharacterized protein n=1 Tax=Brassicogethes aeneus TaxID=1431903 RepID=A0A9P0FFL2_BRAAE|nr:unnamed protein product [Brassicogethes aeneus]